LARILESDKAENLVSLSAGFETAGFGISFADSTTTLGEETVAVLASAAIGF
jgi:hypothetical protein